MWKLIIRRAHGTKREEREEKIVESRWLEDNDERRQNESWSVTDVLSLSLSLFNGYYKNSDCKSVFVSKGKNSRLIGRVQTYEEKNWRFEIDFLRGRFLGTRTDIGTARCAKGKHIKYWKFVSDRGNTFRRRGNKKKKKKKKRKSPSNVRGIYSILHFSTLRTGFPYRIVSANH